MNCVTERLTVEAMPSKKKKPNIVNAHFRIGEAVVYEHDLILKESSVESISATVGFTVETVRYTLSDGTHRIECDLFKNSTEAIAFYRKHFNGLLDKIKASALELK